ncbi:MAG: RNA 2',3'-cyclic phosphodiesterase [Campylobacterota bacterium]|nr:RNA 2',3'-cyclic phosphodiesterase [Campylobacterota bacterium]
MRLFIASPVKLDKYASIQEDFKDIVEGKWVEEEHLHMTWVFLGDLKNDKPIINKLQDLFPLENEIGIEEMGYFGRPPRVLFAKAEEKQLYNKAREFKEAGFDLYRFKPHITLCRIKAIHDYRAYKEKIKAYKEKKLGIILPKIALYESMRTSKGLEYQAKFELPSSQM